MLPALILIALAQSAAPAPPPDAARCTAAEHRQFDFWIGDWEVHSAQGRLLGFNRITPILGGCALQEEWNSADGKVRGVSLNAYDPADSRWHQAWVDTAPSRLALVGGLAGRDMVMEQRPPTGGPGAGAVQRITWRPLPDGRVRQLWESSSDEGRTWTTAFDGYYSRRSPGARP